MKEAFVQLDCPDCEKAWESTPSELPAPTEDFECPDCQMTRRTSEFTRTERDLEVLKQLA